MRTAARIAGWVIVALLLVTLGAYLALDREHASLDAGARAAAPGKFARLTDGVTHYELAGVNDKGRTVVLLSGATVPYYIWDSTAAALSTHGFRVLRYDYYGRGYSDRPALRYDLATYDRQLTELLDTLGIRGQIDIAGVSMGGAIAASFADAHPDRVWTITLVDPAIGVSRETPLPLRSTFTGNLALTFGASSMAKGQLDDFVHPERYPDWVSRYEPQMRFRGFRRSILETQRHDVFKRPARSFQTLARSGLPMLILWGKEDHTVPFALSDSIRAAFPRAEFHAINGAGHLPHIEQAAVVDSILLKFLDRSAGLDKVARASHKAASFHAAEFDNDESLRASHGDWRTFPSCRAASWRWRATGRRPRGADCPPRRGDFLPGRRLLRAAGHAHRGRHLAKARADALDGWPLGGCFDWRRRCGPGLRGGDVCVRAEGLI